MSVIRSAMGAFMLQSEFHELEFVLMDSDAESDVQLPWIHEISNKVV